MYVNIRYSSIYNVGTNKQSSRAKDYQMGIYNNWDWVSPKYTNWDILTHTPSKIMFQENVDNYQPITLFHKYSKVSLGRPLVKRSPICLSIPVFPQLWDTDLICTEYSRNYWLTLVPLRPSEGYSFSVGRRTDIWDLSWLGIERNSFSVGRRTNVCDSSRLGLEPNSLSVGRRPDVWDSSGLGLESINSFGNILCK